MSIVNHNSRGAIALVVIVMITAIIVVFGVSVALTNIDEIRSANAWFSTTNATALADACVEEDLAQLLNDSNLNGNVNLSISNVNCSSYISGSGAIRSILANATSSDAFNESIVSRVDVLVNVNSNPFTIERYKDILQ